jgi:hypothetical protein
MFLVLLFGCQTLGYQFKQADIPLQKTAHIIFYVANLIADKIDFLTSGVAETQRSRLPQSQHERNGH